MRPMKSRGQKNAKKMYQKATSLSFVRPFCKARSYVIFLLAKFQWKAHRDTLQLAGNKLLSSVDYEKYFTKDWTVNYHT